MQEVRLSFLRFLVASVRLEIDYSRLVANLTKLSRVWIRLNRSLFLHGTTAAFTCVTHRDITH